MGFAAEAVQLYTQALAGAPKEAALYANRSAGYLALGAKIEAYHDAKKATQLSPEWAKGYYRRAPFSGPASPCGSSALAADDAPPCRLGMACMALFDYDMAAWALARGVRLEPGNRDMAARLSDAEAHAEYEAACKRVHVGLQQRDLVLKLRGVRLRGLGGAVRAAAPSPLHAERINSAGVWQARRAEVQESMERQFKQSMTAPDWEMEDYEW